MLRDIFFVGEVRNEIPHFRQEYGGFIPPSIFLLASYKCFQYMEALFVKNHG